MIVAYTRINNKQDILIKELCEKYIVEIRFELFPITSETFDTFIGAERFYSHWVWALMEN